MRTVGSLSISNRLGVFALTALCSVGMAGVGCSGSDEGGGAADAATSVDSGAAQDSPSSSGDSGGVADTSTTDTGTAAETGTDAGAVAYLQECKTVGTPGDCAPGLTCKLFSGKQKNFCTKPCTKATAATDCPAPAKGCGGDNFCSPP